MSDTADGFRYDLLTRAYNAGGAGSLAVELGSSMPSLPLLMRPQICRHGLLQIKSYIHRGDAEGAESIFLYVFR